MRRSLIVGRRPAGRVAVLTAATVLCGLITPAIGYAAPPAPPSPTVEAPAPSVPEASVPRESPDAAAAELPSATETEKVRAVFEIEVGEATKEWREATDMNFVFKVYDKIDATNFPVTKAEAYRVYKVMLDNNAAPDATAFIRTGVFDFAARDRVERQRRQEAWDRTVQLRREILIDADIVGFDDVMLNDNDQMFIYKVYQKARPEQPKLKQGAFDAFGGDAAVWKDFIENKIRALNHQDQLDYLDRLNQENQEAARREAARMAKKDACDKVPVIAVAAWLDLADDDFIRELLKTPELADPAHREIKNAATVALTGLPADWNAYIRTGVAEARARDDARILREREEADRQKVRDIKAKADASRLRPRLAAAAADVAANGTWDQVKDFLAKGQYTVLEQAFAGVTAGRRGWHVRSAGGDAWATPGTQPSNVVTAPLGDATWKIVPGLADPNCFSLESATRVGSYLRIAPNLRVQLAGNDGTDGYKLNATWCAKAGRDGNPTNVTLEAKAYPGRYLRQYWGELWAANGQSKENNFDTDGNFAADISWIPVGPNPSITTKIDERWLNEDWWGWNGLGPQTQPENILNGIRYKRFQKGGAFWSAQHGVVRILDPLLNKYLESGGRNIPGFIPSGDTGYLPDGKGMRNLFAGPRGIWYHPDIGPKLIYGAIFDRWAALQYERSRLGYPTSDEMDFPGVPGKRVSYFQHGRIEHTAAEGAKEYYN
ncbi:AbfB domain-containing protein [Amycolatopsis sp. MJM2582]|uniref:AbfB domain-containing protein n=1 Tax=Amycolatopsis sp. MJM2582 TaxID=1427749 RepID=UPI0006901A09|nr:AbfB domain-containing protein [Amycolatopsis sp. MJM2582]